MTAPDDRAVTAIRLAKSQLDCDEAGVPFSIPDGAVRAAVVGDLVGLLNGAIAKNGFLESLLTEEQRAEYVSQPGPDVFGPEVRSYVRGELDAIMANSMLGDIGDES